MYILKQKKKKVGAVFPPVKTHRTSNQGLRDGVVPFIFIQNDLHIKYLILPHESGMCWVRGFSGQGWMALPGDTPSCDSILEAEAHYSATVLSLG